MGSSLQLSTAFSLPAKSSRCQESRRSLISSWRQLWVWWAWTSHATESSWSSLAALQISTYPSMISRMESSWSRQILSYRTKKISSVSDGIHEATESSISSQSPRFSSSPWKKLSRSSETMNKMKMKVRQEHIISLTHGALESRSSIALKSLMMVLQDQLSLQELSGMHIIAFKCAQICLNFSRFAQNLLVSESLSTFMMFQLKLPILRSI